MSFLNKLSRNIIRQHANRSFIYSGKSFTQFSLTLRNREDSKSEDEHSNVVYDFDKDRSEHIDVETSIKYIESKAFKEAYGDNLIWTLYKRNKTGHFLGPTRKTCIRSNKISTASPCPICRDKYLILDYRNTKLLQQFISPYSGEILPSIKTGVCQRQHFKLVLAIMKAKEYGTISFDVPFRRYDYQELIKCCREKSTD